VVLLNELKSIIWHLFHCIHVGLTRTVYIHTVYDRIFGDDTAKSTTCTPYIHGSK